MVLKPTKCNWVYINTTQLLAGMNKAVKAMQADGGFCLRLRRCIVDNGILMTESIFYLRLRRCTTCSLKSAEGCQSYTVRRMLSCKCLTQGRSRSPATTRHLISA